MPAVCVEQPSPGRAGLNLLLIGPPGAGKGSLAGKLCSLNLEHISSGEFFRAEAARGTRLGGAYAGALAKGEFISDELTLALMRKWFFARKSPRGFLLDGFPRNLLQAEVFDEWLETRRETLTACIYLELTLEDALQRISQRRVCPECKTVYHLSFHRPAASGRCDHCGGELVQRSDDTEETVVRRWRLFEENTLPLVSYYREQGLLCSFDAARPMDAVHSDVIGSLTTFSLT